jgi:hypothetical protein
MQPSARPMVSLGDVLRAVARLDADAVTARRIAELLGQSQADDAPAAPGDPVHRQEIRPSDGRPKVEAGGSFSPAIDTVADTVARQVITSTLDPVETNDFAGVQAVPLAKPSSLDDGWRPPFTPLFWPDWSRAILTAGLSTASEDGALDVDAIVTRLATRTPIPHLPRLPLPTMRRGVQLLLDRGPALVPFSRDQDWLAERTRAVAGTDRVELLDFYVCPTRDGQLGEDGEPIAYRPPAPGTTVVAMTDLGITHLPGGEDRADPVEWLAFVEGLRKIGSPFLALVPYPERRWPPALAQKIAIATFDRSTSASNVRRIVRGGNRGLR